MGPPAFIQTPAREYDFIVCGGGIAGNTVAGRLAELPNVSVLVIEAGKSPYGVKAISTPALATTLVESEYDWQYQATLVDRSDFKRVENAVTRGKVLGGSSSLNYYSWHRGTAAQYNEWELYGGKTWNWEACKPYFSKPTTVNTTSKPSLLPITLTNVGSNGPIKLRIVDPTPMGDAVVKGWLSKGYPLANDIFNGYANGLTHLVASVDNGVRWSSVAFLEDKPNISVLAETRVAKVVLQGRVGNAGEEYIATGVEIVDGTFIKAKKEVIVSGGVFESPHLLMLSGIGPKEELSKYGIDCKINNQHVGRNLQEHVIMPQVFKLKEGSSLDTWLRPGPQFEAAVREYDEFKTGPLASPILEFSAYMRIDDRLASCPAYIAAKERNGGKDPLGPNGTPHFEFDFVPCFFKSFQPHIPPPTSGDFTTIVSSFMRPISRGRVTLRSSDPTDQPEINLNFFGEDADLEAMREAARFVRNILTTGESLKDIVLGPYPDDLADLDGDNEAANRLVLKRCSTGYHPCGTCRIGQASGEYAGVLDEKMKVRGVANLRVIDASSIPLMPDCRIQAGVYMLGEKGADLIKQTWSQ